MCKSIYSLIKVSRFLHTIVYNLEYERDGVPVKLRFQVSGVRCQRSRALGQYASLSFVVKGRVRFQVSGVRFKRTEVRRQMTEDR